MSERSGLLSAIGFGYLALRIVRAAPTISSCALVAMGRVRESWMVYSGTFSLNLEVHANTVMPWHTLPCLLNFSVQRTAKLATASSITFLSVMPSSAKLLLVQMLFFCGS